MSEHRKQERHANTNGPMQKQSENAFFSNGSLCDDACLCEQVRARAPSVAAERVRNGRTWPKAMQNPCAEPATTIVKTNMKTPSVLAAVEMVRVKTWIMEWNSRCLKIFTQVSTALKATM